MNQKTTTNRWSRPVLLTAALAAIALLPVAAQMSVDDYIDQSAHEEQLEVDAAKAQTDGDTSYYEPEVYAAYDARDMTVPYDAAISNEHDASVAYDDISVEIVMLTPKELADLVGPIALYPDDLLAIVLPASTYPEEILQAARFLDKHKADSSLQPNENWDESVTALLNYPEVLRMMADDSDWTWQLGGAVLNQQQDVVEAVEAFRDRAYLAGNLKTDEYQTVSYDGDNIEIIPTRKEVIYVPYYEPRRVVVRQVEPVYYYYPRPYPVYYYPYPSDYSFFNGFFWGVTTAYRIGWSNHHLFVHHHSFHSHPYFGYRYHGHYYRRPSLTVYNTWYVNNSGRHTRNRDRDGDYWRPRPNSTGHPNGIRKPTRRSNDSRGTVRADRDVVRTQLGRDSSREVPASYNHNALPTRQPVKPQSGSSNDRRVADLSTHREDPELLRNRNNNGRDSSGASVNNLAKPQKPQAKPQQRVATPIKPGSDQFRFRDRPETRTATTQTGYTPSTQFDRAKPQQAQAKPQQRATTPVKPTSSEFRFRDRPETRTATAQTGYVRPAQTDQAKPQQQQAKPRKPIREFQFRDRPETRAAAEQRGTRGNRETADTARTQARYTTSRQATQTAATVQPAPKPATRNTVKPSVDRARSATTTTRQASSAQRATTRQVKPATTQRRTEERPRQAKESTQGSAAQERKAARSDKAESRSKRKRSRR